jgi:hypothetical protein
MEVDHLLHHIRIRNRTGRRLLTTGASLACLVATAVAPAAASATSGSGSTGTVTNGVYCDEAMSAAFSAFGDSNLYALAPGGDFEGDLAGWTVGAAKQVAGSEPYNVTGSAGSSALEVPAGTAVTSAPVCLDPTRDKFRFFVRSMKAKARLRVDALLVRAGQSKASVVSVGYVSSSTGVWEPTPILRNQASKYIAAGSTGSVTYRFSAENGAVQIDDLHIDPRRIR